MSDDAITASQVAVPDELAVIRPDLVAKTRPCLLVLGRDMGYMRQLKSRQKAQVRKVREAKGVRAAIVTAREMAGR